MSANTLVMRTVEHVEIQNPFMTNHDAVNKKLSKIDGSQSMFGDVKGPPKVCLLSVKKWVRAPVQVVVGRRERIPSMDINLHESCVENFLDDITVLFCTIIMYLIHPSLISLS